MLKKDSDKILERFLKDAVEYKKLSVQTITQLKVKRGRE